MRLCFGTFATVLYNCRQDINQAGLVERIAKAVDPKTRYIIGDDPDTQKSEANKLLKCTKKFILSNGTDTYRLPLKSVIKNFKTEVAPFIDEDKKAKVIFALLDIIRKDRSLDSNKKENFKKYFGVEKKDLLKKSEFEFSDFLGRTLMYTVCGNVDNTVGKEYVKSITYDYIENIAKPYLYEYQWNSKTQTITLTFEIVFQEFQKSILDNDIKKFIEDVDPSIGMSDDWPENHVNFISSIYNIISTHIDTNNLTENIGFTFEYIQHFIEKFNEYTDYISCRMDPLIGSTKNILVPRLHSAIFTEETKKYRKQLISIYLKIYAHMLYAQEYLNTGASEETEMTPIRKHKDNS